MDVIWPINLSNIKFVFELPSNIKFIFQLPAINLVDLSNISALITSLQSLLVNYWQLFTFYLPLGIIGLWRWGTWVMKKILGLFYRPQKGQYESSVSIITPVYNETPQVFIDALVSWAKNSPDEIIAVIDYSDTKCIKIFEDFIKVFPQAKLIITQKPGKREALADGIRSASSEIVALVDSDTIWAEGVLKEGLIPFRDVKVAGVATRQNVLNPQTLAQKIFDIQLDLRYFDEFTFLGATGDALICLSGRTAFYRREVISPMIPDLVNETFWGQKVVSGDDKRLTYLVLAAGWKVAYQKTSHVFTPGVEDLKSYFKQRLRWTRNSLRADLRAIYQGWVFHHPSLAYFQIDKVIQGVTTLLSPFFFIVALTLQHWSVALIIFIWWFVSRTIKLYPHLKRRPQDITVLPAFIIFNFVSAGMKIYAIFTLNTQGWITRWDTSRLPQFKFLSKVPAYAGTTLVFIGLLWGVFGYRQQFSTSLVSAQQATTNNLITLSSIEDTDKSQVLGASSLDNTNQMLVTKYVIKPGDSLSKIARNNGITLENLLQANINILPNWSQLTPGYILNIPRSDFLINGQHNYSYTKITPDVLQITFDQPSNTILVQGRGRKVTLADIQAKVGKEKLEETSSQNWILRSNLWIRNGVMLVLDKKEIAWLKLASSKDGFVTLRSNNGLVVINGVKITSWNEENNDFDRDYKDGRSYILVKDFSRMDIYNSELAYLGYGRTQPTEDSVYGVSWRMSNGKLGTHLLTGEVLNNKFHHNYFGTYTFGATSILWRGNEFFENIRYGLDPHDDSNNFIVENNKFYNNGSHGLIFSKRCINNIIRNNLSYNNKLHGIMLHESSNDNLIENNTVTGNVDGIAIYHSSNNTIRNNTISQNQRGIRVNQNSMNNLFEENQIKENKQYGFYLYDESNNNVIANNKIMNNQNALYLKTKNNQVIENLISDNKIGLYLVENAAENKFINNQVINNSTYGIYSKTSAGNFNYLGQNTIIQNGQDIYPN